MGRGMTQDRARVSACLITYNEEKNIRRCLERLDWADEIVVVDAFSQDATVEIAGQFTDRIFQSPWVGYVRQKNLALDQASHEWAFGIDADEVVSSELQASILDMLSRPQPGTAGYRVARRTFYLGRWIDHCGWYPEYRLRLFRKDEGRWTGRDLHERVGVRGAVRSLRGDLYHYPYESIADHLRTIDRYASISAWERFQRGTKFRWTALMLHPLARFLKMFLLKRGFLDGGVGLIVSALGGIYVFAKYVKLWELERVGADTAQSEDPSRPPRGHGLDLAWRRSSGSGAG